MVGSMPDGEAAVTMPAAATVASFNGLSGIQLRQNIQRFMRVKVPGNNRCADCDRPGNILLFLLSFNQ